MFYFPPERNRLRKMSLASQQEKMLLTDDALVEMLGLNHEWALKEVFNRYHQKLFRIAAGVLQDDDLAKDMVQDVFIDLWNRRQSSNIQILSHYLTRAIKFQVLRWLRDHPLNKRHIELIEAIPSTDSIEETLHLQELESKIQSAIGQLPPRCREVFELSRFENLSNKEIADRLNISVKTVEVQMTKALAFLKAALTVVMMSYHI